MKTQETSIKIKAVCGACKTGNYDTYIYEYTPEGLWYNCPGCDSTHLDMKKKKYEFKNLYLKYNKDLKTALYKGLKTGDISRNLVEEDEVVDLDLDEELLDR